jgi:DNA modification methylase
MMSNPKMWRYNLVWNKVLKTGFLNAARMPLRQHEDICVFYKKLPTYNPQMTKCEPHKRNHSKGNWQHPEVNRCYGSYVETPTIISDEKFPTSIIREPKQHIKGKSYHPTEKPVGLLRYLIRTYTNENDAVLDNCMGSGSTIVAAIKEKRQYIGIEKDEHFFEIAKQRIDNELIQPTLF